MSIFARLKSAPEVYPLIGIVGGACCIALFFGSRAALKYPDVAWDHKNNPHPWLKIKPNEQVTLFSVGDISKMKSDRPEI